jgi:hypothetical protein
LCLHLPHTADRAEGEGRVALLVGQNVASLCPLRSFQRATFPDHGKGLLSISLAVSSCRALTAALSSLLTTLRTMFPAGFPCTAYDTG